MIDYDGLRLYLDKLTEIVRRENHPKDDVELAIHLAREIKSRASLKIFLCPVKAVTTVLTEDFVIVQIYTELLSSGDGLYGFGYAYNVTDPDLSEVGYLWTPSETLPSSEFTH